jgi:uncharacterized protein (TIGR03067 family)
MRRLALVLMLGGVAHPAGATTAAEEAAALAGAWTAVTAEQNGAPAPELVGHRLVFTGDAFAIYATGGKLLYGGTYSIDPAARPARIDFHGTAGGDAGKTWGESTASTATASRRWTMPPIPPRDARSASPHRSARVMC